MALLDFPTGPQLNDTTTQNGNTWKWNGTSWVAFNNLSLTSQVTGVLGTVYGGTGKALSSLTVGSVIYADSSSSFAALPPGSNNYVLASAGTGNTPFWKVDDSGTGSVGSGTTGGFAYYTGLNSITSGSGFSLITGSGNGGTIVFTNGLLSLIGSTINSGTWAGSAVALAYGGTNNTISGVGHSYRVAIYDAAGTAITNISSAGTANSVLFQTSQSTVPSWVGQNTLVVGGASTAAQWQTSRTITFGTGDVTGSFSINGSADVSNVALTIAANSVALGTDTTGNYAQSVTGAGNGLSTIGTAGEGTDFTIHSNATSANTVSTLVFRDGSGNFSAGTISANLTGTASIASSAAAVNTVTDTSSTLYLLGSRSSTGIASTQVYVDTNISFSGNTITATNFSGLASSASNLFGGVASAGASIHIQTGVNTTSFLAHPGSAGQALTTTSNGFAYSALSNLAVTSLAAGNGIALSASTGNVTVSNIGVTSITGTANRITVTSSLGSSNGAITLNLPQDIATTSTPTFANIIIDGGTSSTLAAVGSNPTSMVNKQYVDNLASGLDIHASVRVVSTSSIGASYVQSQPVGTAATGAYLISTTQVALPAIDGVTFTATGTTQRILVAGGASGRTSINGGAFSTSATPYLVNGIYYVGALGGAGTSNWILVRATDTDDSTELTAGTFAFVEEGSLYADTGWVCSNDTTNLGPIQFGGTGISFTQFTGAAAISFGQGLTRVGNTVAANINLSPTGAASGIGYTQFNIGGQSVGGAADTGYYPTFSVRTSGTTVSGSALLTLNSDGFSLVGSTNTNRTLTVSGGDIILTGGGNTLTLTGSISLPSPTQYALAFGTSATALGFLSVGTASSVLFQTNNTTNPTWVGQNTLVVGGATTAANVQGGAASQLHYQTGANTTGFVSNAAGSGASILSQTGSAAPIYLGQAQLVVGGATTSANIQGGVASQLLYQSSANTTAFVSNAAGSGASILTQTGSAAPLFFGQSQLVVGGATTAANIQGGAASQILYQSGANATAFVSNAAGSGASILSQTGSAAPVYLGQAQLVVGGATTSANIQGGAASQLLYQSGANATAFVSNAAGSGASILTQTGSAAPLFFGQSQLVVGGATTSANIQGGAASQILYQSGANTTAFVSNAAGSGASVLTQTGSAAPVYLGQAQLSVGSATNATNSTNVNVTAASGSGNSYLAFVSGTSGNLPILIDTNITVDAATNTITANLTGIATSSTRVGITTSVSTSDLPIVFADAHQPYAALGSSTLLTYQASTGKITTGIWAGTAITTGRGGTGLQTVSANQVLIGAATGNTWAALGSTYLPVVGISTTPPPQPGGAIGATQAGQLWWDSEYGVLKVFYNDGNTSQWVDATPVLGSSGGGSSVKRSYVMTFGAGFTPSTGADTVQIQVPYAPDNTSKFYYIKRLDYRNETTAGGSGVTFFIERHTTGSVAFSPSFRIHTAGSGVGASFVVGPTTYNASYTLAATGASFVSSAGVAASVISGDYLRLNFTTIGSAATLSVSMILEEQ